MRNLAISHIFLALITAWPAPAQDLRSGEGVELGAQVEAGAWTLFPGHRFDDVDGIILRDRFEVAAFHRFLPFTETHLEQWSDLSILGHYGNRENLELMIKILDGCSVNDYWWVYISTTSDLPQFIDIFDHAGELGPEGQAAVRTYVHPGGNPNGSILDSAAWRCNP